MSQQPGRGPVAPDPEEPGQPDQAQDERDVVPDEAEAEDAHAAAERKRRLDEVFGSGEHHGGGKGDAWYRDQIPPHHG